MLAVSLASLSNKEKNLDLGCSLCYSRRKGMRDVADRLSLPDELPVKTGLVYVFSDF